MEESRLQELATKGDIREIELKLEAKIEAAKVETIKWVIATGIIILGGVATINRFFPPSVPVYPVPPAQEMRLPAPPSAPVR
ncbi:MAG: hypothetical protein HQM00_11560 [Magnetococcales bacterium]|nr:hypothetical protein [Magnetococcales bacterium]